MSQCAHWGPANEGTAVSARRLVVLGMMTKMPVAGVVWQTLHYLIGLRRLGYDVYYVEAHARTPSMFMTDAGDDGSERATAFIHAVLRPFDLGDRWAYHALHSDGRVYGLADHHLFRLYRSADLLINLHGGTQPLAEHSATDRLVYLETDPVTSQLELAGNYQPTIDFLAQHCAFFTFAENYGNLDCRLPVSERFLFRPTRQPVVLDFWNGAATAPTDAFTTVANWQQPWRDVTFAGELYRWSKDLEFRRFLSLPQELTQAFELALSNCPGSDRQLLEQHGWRVRDGLELSLDANAYRCYIQASRGEFTVAKDQNVRLRTGWFSDRSATYLAASRPVVTQETGFSNILPTGEGLFGFSSLDEVVVAVEAINADYDRHSRAAGEVAREYFDSGVVLGALLSELDIASPARAWALPHDLVLVPRGRRPITLGEETEQVVLGRPLPARRTGGDAPATRASIVVVTFNNLLFTRMCLESVLDDSAGPPFELIVVDNASTDGTIAYLGELATRDRRLRTIFNDTNRGFAAAANQGMAAAAAGTLILLNNDTILPPRWLRRLTAHLADPTVGAVGPLTNRIGTEAEIQVSYTTYGQLLDFAERRFLAEAGRRSDVAMLAMFCMALRRDVVDRVGPLDERFAVGLLEDDDYALRLKRQGYRLVLAEDVFVHHFGQASFAKLVPTGEYAEILGANLQRFREKWGIEWQPYARRPMPSYEEMIEQVRRVAADLLPSDATVVVISRGDDDLLQLGASRRAWHFPQRDDGVYAGHYPGESSAAIKHLEELRARGAEFVLIPRTAIWWLDYYTDFHQHLRRNYRFMPDPAGSCLVLDVRQRTTAGVLTSASRTPVPRPPLPKEDGVVAMSRPTKEP